MKIEKCSSDRVAKLNKKRALSFRSIIDKKCHNENLFGLSIQKSQVKNDRKMRMIRVLSFRISETFI